MVDVSNYLDAYTMRARLLPGLLAVLPLAVTCYAWNPGNILDWNALGGIIVGFGGTIVLAFIARDLGKAAEDRLYAKWGGRPTEVLLCHSSDMDPALRARRHAALRMFFKDVPVPTVEEEARDREGAQKRFKTLTQLTISRYREQTDKFPLVFEENCNYGFRRNMYGLRPIGIAVSLITTVALGLQLFMKFSSHEPVPVVSLGMEAVNVIMLLVWLLWTNESSVRHGANLYAERLFETLDAPGKQTKIVGFSK
ncbi:MAG TPA: hypothetical protein VEL51_22420 [Vicinamibacterales bacterium]|nr:hypothetical protein [Vicinamibacterales bacterium]